MADLPAPGGNVWSLDSSDDLEAIGRVRRAVVAVLAAWGADPDDAALRAGELLNNAMEHGGPPRRVSCGHVDGLVRCTVQDAEPAMPELRHPDRHGRGVGLFVVGALSHRWGASRVQTPDGAARKSVWFELAATEA